MPPRKQNFMHVSTFLQSQLVSVNIAVPKFRIRIKDLVSIAIDWRKG